jgi:hypothetical protein
MMAMYKRGCHAANGIGRYVELPVAPIATICVRGARWLHSS